MAPVVKAMRAEQWAECRVVRTGQHREMVDEALECFGIRADVDLNVMTHDQTLSNLTARLLTALDQTIAKETPSFLLAQGDTTTVLAAALASFYRKVPFGHVEAGLRTNRLDTPFPEEGNRQVASRLAAIHFAPTEEARGNLLREGIEDAKIVVTGNTVIDALLDTASRATPETFDPDSSARWILVTAHRRDSFGAPLRRICQAVKELHDGFPDVRILWPIHPNPAVGPVVSEEMAGLARVRLCAPLPYAAFVAAMKRAFLVLTDSGGVQEEAPALGKPVLVLRDESERPEAIAAGVARLVGTDSRVIVGEATRLLTDPVAYHAMARGISPYGDGHAGPRIAATLARLLSVTGRASSPST